MYVKINFCVHGHSNWMKVIGASVFKLIYEHNL